MRAVLPTSESSHAPVDRRTRTQILLAAGVIATAVLASYAGSFSGAFVFDDRTVTTENPSIRALWPLSTVLSPPANAGTGGRPFANLTFALNYAVSGHAVWSYHALNVALHVLSGLTLFGLVRRLLQWAPLAARFGRDAVGLALVTALVWALSPLQTQTVTYISQRTEVLAGLCFLFTLYASIRAMETDSLGWRSAAVVACTLGVASKEIVATAPLIVLLFDRTLVSGSFRAAWIRRRAFYAGLGATWLLLAWLMIGSGLAVRGVGYNAGVDTWDFMRTQCRALTIYLSLAVWPHPLIFDRGLEVLRHFADAAPYVAALTLPVAATLEGLRRRSPLGLVGACFFIIVAPTSSVVPIALAPIAENRAYLPSAAIAVLLVLAGYAAIGRKSVLAFFAVAVALGLLTTRRNDCYQSEVSLWRDTVAQCPLNARANYNLGRALEADGRLDEAARYYAETLRLNPAHAKASNNLGNLRVNQGRIPEAIAYYERAVQLTPDFFEARLNLGSRLAQLDRLPAALVELERATQIAPDSAEAHFRFATALMAAGKNGEAAGHFEQAIRCAPAEARSHHGLGSVLLAAQHLPAAIGELEQALRLDRNLPETHSNLSNALLAVGRTDEAIAHAEQALRLRPDYADAHHNLGLAFLRAGRWSEAKPQLEAILRLQPNDAAAHNDLGLAFAQLGQTAEAIAHFQEAVRLNPGFAAARTNLAQQKEASAGRP